MNKLMFSSLPWIMPNAYAWTSTLVVDTYRICANTSINAHADVSSRARGQNFGMMFLSLCLRAAKALAIMRMCAGSPEPRFSIKR